MEKVRRERDDLTAVVSQDKYKSMKTVEHSLNETAEAKVGLLKQVEKMSVELT